MNVITTLGMYPVYSLFPYSYRRLLRMVHPHLSKVVVDTEREKAKKKIVHSFRRMQVYNLLCLSIPKSEMWLDKYSEEARNFYTPLYRQYKEDYEKYHCKVTSLLYGLDPPLPAVTMGYKCRSHNYISGDLINYIFIPLSNRNRVKISLTKYRYNWVEESDEIIEELVLFDRETDGSVRLNMNRFPAIVVNCRQFIRVSVNDKECDIIVVASFLRREDRVALCHNPPPIKDITVETFNERERYTCPSLEFKRNPVTTVWQIALK